MGATFKVEFRMRLIVTAAAVFVFCFGALHAEAGKYRFSVKGDKVLLNDTSFKVIGLRTSNALVSDAATDLLIKNLDTFKGYGVNTVSVYVMGSHFGDVKGYKPDGSLDPVHAVRLARIIEAADDRGMVVLVGCLYWGASRAKADLSKWTQEDANKAVANTVAWLSKNKYRNVFVDVDNEGMAHANKRWDDGKMIDAGHAVDPNIMLANNCPGVPPDSADLLIHYSKKDNRRPWIQTEGAAGGGGNYWGGYSLQGGFHNYIRIGRYTPKMKETQLKSTHADIEKYAGILWWLQDVKNQYGAWKRPPG